MNWQSKQHQEPARGSAVHSATQIGSTGPFRTGRRVPAVAYAFAIACSIPSISFAHHSAAGRFDPAAIIEIEGEVVEMGWRNPHSYFIVATTDEEGRPVTWSVETDSISFLLRIGIQRDSIQVGDRIRVAGQAPLTTKLETFATNILTASGEELLVRNRSLPRWSDRAIGDPTFQRQSEGDRSRPELGLFRVWSHTDLSGLFGSRGRDPSAYPLTPAASAAVRGFDPVTDNPTRNCTPKGMPTIMEQPYPMEFVESGSNIVLRIEEYDTVRTIHMNQGETPADTAASDLGYSTGRWEGSTLVVTTTRISWPWFNQRGIPQSDSSRLVERFTPTEAGSRLDYELVIVDPVNFSAAVKLTKYWLDIAGRDVHPFDCQAVP